MGIDRRGAKRLQKSLTLPQHTCLLVPAKVVCFDGKIPHLQLFGCAVVRRRALHHLAIPKHREEGGFTCIVDTKKDNGALLVGKPWQSAAAVGCCNGSEGGTFGQAE